MHYERINVAKVRKWFTKHFCPLEFVEAWLFRTLICCTTAEATEGIRATIAEVRWARAYDVESMSSDHKWVHKMKSSGVPCQACNIYIRWQRLSPAYWNVAGREMAKIIVEKNLNHWNVKWASVLLFSAFPLCFLKYHNLIIHMLLKIEVPDVASSVPRQRFS